MSAGRREWGRRLDGAPDLAPGQLEALFVVSPASDVSTLADVLFRATPYELGLQVAGGLELGACRFFATQGDALVCALADLLVANPDEATRELERLVGDALTRKGGKS